MQMSKQFLTLTTNFLLLIINRYGEEYSKVIIAAAEFCREGSPAEIL